MTSEILDDGMEVLDAGPTGDEPTDLAGRMARRRVAEREAELAAEVRRLMKAAEVVFRRCGTKESPRLADILAEAGMSNDAFYRHFKSKDELVVAILEDGTRHFREVLAARMATEDQPQHKVAVWVRGVLGQVVDHRRAEALRAAMWNVARTADDTTRRIAARTYLMQVLLEPITALGSDDPERDARSIGDATLGRLEHFMWRREAPTEADLDHLVAFCLRAISRTDKKATDE